MPRELFDPSRCDWADLRVFLAVAQTGSFSGAARALHMGQPAVSKRVDYLENRLGTVLCLRGADGVTLTEAGKTVADHALTMHRSVQAIEKSVAFRDQSISGIVRLSCPDGLGSFWLAAYFPEFRRAYPDVRLDLTIKPPSNVDASSSLDLTIQFVEAKRMDDVAIPLGYVHYVPFATREYLELYGEPKTLVDLLQHRTILHTDYRNQLERWAQTTKPLQDLAEPSLIADSGPAMLVAAAAGGGIAILPSYVTVLDPRLEVIDVGGVMAKLQFWLVFDRERGQLARCRTVIDWLKSVFDGRTNPWFRAEYVHPKEFGRAQHPWATR